MQALNGLLRPLVRALIAQGVTAPALYRLLKRLYVDVAEREFRLDDERPTDSRISLLTGVHRRDVREFRDAADPNAGAARQKVTAIASVIGRWLAMAGDNGGAQNVPALSRSGADSFESLVQSVSRDIRPKTVLDELLRQGLVDVSSTDGSVSLRTEELFGPGDLDQKMHFFAENVGDHLAAAVDNLLAEQPRFMERAVFYNRLQGGSVDELERVARQLGSEALIDLNGRASALQAQDVDLPEGTERFRFGVFFYREDEADEPTKTRNGNGGKDAQS